MSKQKLLNKVLKDTANLIVDLMEEKDLLELLHSKLGDYLESNCSDDMRDEMLLHLVLASKKLHDLRKDPDEVRLKKKIKEIEEDINNGASKSDVIEKIKEIKDLGFVKDVQIVERAKTASDDEPWVDIEGNPLDPKFIEMIKEDKKNEKGNDDIPPIFMGKGGQA